MPPRSDRRELDPINSLWDLAAITLQRLRLDRSLSQEAVGEIIKRDRSTVARIETGESKLREEHARTIDTAWKTGGILTGIVHQALTRHDASWSAERTVLQAKASQLLIWELGWLPGIFQTEAYMRASFLGSGLRKEAEEGVRNRLKDQAAVNKTGPEIRCILDQGVIEQPVGGPEVMHEQLATLLHLSEQHTIRVVPRAVGAHPGRDGAFWIMTVGGSDVVYTEAFGPGRLVREPAEVRSYGVWFARISDVGLSRAESHRLIRHTLEGFI